MILSLLMVPRTLSDTQVVLNFLGPMEKIQYSPLPPQRLLYAKIKCLLCPVWCGSVGWVLSHKPKGHQFNSDQGTCLGCKFNPKSGRCGRQPIDVSLQHQCFSSFFPPFPSLYKQTNFF